MSREIETIIEYCQPEWAYISSTERRWETRIAKLKWLYPDQVEILKVSAENDGCTYAKIPVKWVKLLPPRKCTMTEEQRAIRAKNLRDSRWKRSIAAFDSSDSSENDS